MKIGFSYENLCLRLKVCRLRKGMVIVMREVEFKMERQGLVKENDKVTIIERYSPSNYYYIIEPAVAMSGCFPLNKRIVSRVGTVKEIQHTDRGYYVIVEFDE